MAEKTDRPPLTLETPIQYAHGVGPARTPHLLALGIKTAGDLLTHFPREYLQYAAEAAISSFKPGDMATVRGVVAQTRMHRSRPARFEALIRDDAGGTLILTWFNPYGLSEKIHPGDHLRVTGKLTTFNSRLQMAQPKWELLDEVEQSVMSAHIEPVYPATMELPTNKIAKLVRDNLQGLLQYVTEWLPAEFLKDRNLLTRREAFEFVHMPRTMRDKDRARRTLAYHEFLLHQTAVAIKRYQLRHSTPATALRTDEKVDQRIRALLSFTLTAAQERVIGQIKKDLAQTKPMNRLLQGDVGSGKTVVALYAMLTAVATGAQAALIAPTELLAEQHLLTLSKFLKQAKVKVALLVGGQPKAEREKILAGLADGSIGLVIATHAILSAEVRFDHLALVVIDEQHKFGVTQRAIIRSKGAPHTLVMTATPIPRTLAMTAFGDLDVSVIDELPPGRHPIVTRFTPSSNRDQVYTFVATHLKEGEQAYVVLPAIDDDPLGGGPGDAGYAETLRNVTATTQELQARWLKEFRVAAIHGRMATEDRQHIMERFRQKLVDVLVATTVIEVGVDVPNATIMVVEHADRFGLSQLHQLRGRVGRSDKKSFCLLLGDQQTDDAIARLQAMVKHTSGFKIAEEDLKIRGMGQLIGTAQSGVSDLHFQDLLFDHDFLGMARRDAFNTIAADPRLTTPEHGELRKALLEKFGQSISLADVG